MTGLPRFITHDRVGGKDIPRAKKRGRPKGSTHRWLVKAEVAKAIRMRQAGKEYSEIAASLQTTEQTIRNKIKKHSPYLIRKINRGLYQKVKRTDWPNFVTMRKDGKTYEEIAAVYGITRERVRQILNMFAPEYAGPISRSYVHLKCCVCGRESHPWEMDEDRHHFVTINNVKRNNPMLCPEHWRVFYAYRRVAARVAAYHDRYQFIQDEHAKGTPKTHMGYLWKKIPYVTPEYGYYSPTSARLSGTHIWAFRIIKLYEDARARLVIMDTYYPWAENVYKAWVEDLKPEKIIHPNVGNHHAAPKR